jgi:CofH subfamily radical SAM domain protein
VPRELLVAELESFPSLEWPEVAPRVNPAVRGSLEKVLETQNGGDLSLEESCALADAEGDDLLGLLVAANILRAELTGNIVTYVVNRNINFTNICFVGCKFCAFSRGPRESDTYFLHARADGAESQSKRGNSAPLKSAFRAGLPRDLPKFHYRDILRAIKDAVPRMHIHAFSPMEIVYGVELTGMPLADYLSMLRDNGLGTLPGTAAEILDDEIRHILSANKLSTAQWIEVIRTAHRCGIRSTSTMMYGHTETSAHWVRQMRLLREIQSKPEASPSSSRSASFIRTPCSSIRACRALAQLWPSTLKVHALARVLLAGVDQQYSGFVGKAEPPALATLPARRRQRLRRHADGRKHFARSRSDRRPVHQPGRFSSR